MLILNRRINESIIIGDEITVTILSTASNHVKIGIDAPSNISVHREEIYNLIQSELQSKLNSEPSSADELTDKNVI